ncbi:MAG TPA: zf-HC2 domain-containing protein [Trebonia sp.]|jgi:anti-sigma factor RsiW|nr:zf-HC2 domain-containing protein [Trebonia sp.]
MRLLRNREIVCREAVELVTDYLEGTLSRAERKRFEKHLARCEPCTEYLEQIREAISLAGRITAQQLTPQMRDDFVDLYRRWRADG